MCVVTQVYLGLGANLGNANQQIMQAIEALSTHPDLKLNQVSRFYASRPMGPQDQPNYINAVVSIHTNLSPEALLAECQAIEQAHHRKRKRHWGERTLDIDILCYGDLILTQSNLTIPHIGIAERDFVLLPLADIAPEFVIPTLNQTVKQLCHQCPSYGAVPLSD